MADDLGPTTSYSDPFYDRLDAIARVLKRSWPIAVLVFVLAIAGVLAINWAMQRHPEAGSATRFVAARDQQDPVKRELAFAALGADPVVTPAFRARAQIELVQLLLDKQDTATAATAATKAVELAAQGQDPEVQLAAKLTRAAVHAQAGELEQAATAYGEAKRAAGAKFPVAQLEGILGLARVLEKQGKLDDAIVELEPLTARNDAGAEQLLGLARVSYWDLKRRVAEAAAKPAAVPAPQAAAPEAPAAVAVPVPAAEAAPVPVAAPAPAK